MPELKFNQVKNVFSDTVMSSLELHCTIKDTDNSSYDIWPAETTGNNTLPECFSETILGREKLLIINDLYENSDLPCFRAHWLKSADIAIQKITVGGNIVKHYDTCLFSLTVFLNNVEQGGEFNWWDHQHSLYTVPARKNTGIFAYYDGELIQGAPHAVQPPCDQNRYTLQLFVFDKSNPDVNNVKF